MVYCVPFSGNTVPRNEEISDNTAEQPDISVTDRDLLLRESEELITFTQYKSMTVSGDCASTSNCYRKEATIAAACHKAGHTDPHKKRFIGNTSTTGGSL